MEVRVQARDAPGGGGGAGRGATSRGTSRGGAAAGAEGIVRQRAAAPAQRGKAVDAAVTFAGKLGGSIAQRSTRASPGEGATGSKRESGAATNGHETSSARGARGAGSSGVKGGSSSRGAPAESAGNAQPSGRLRQEKGGGEVVAVGVMEGLAPAREAVAVAEPVGVSDLDGVGVPVIDGVGAVRVGVLVLERDDPTDTDRVPDKDGVPVTEEVVEGLVEEAVGLTVDVGLPVGVLVCVTVERGVRDAVT